MAHRSPTLDRLEKKEHVLNATLDRPFYFSGKKINFVIWSVDSSVSDVGLFISFEIVGTLFDLCRDTLQREMVPLKVSGIANLCCSLEMYHVKRIALAAANIRT